MWALLPLLSKPFLHTASTTKLGAIGTHDSRLDLSKANKAFENFFQISLVIPYSCCEGSTQLGVLSRVLLLLLSGGVIYRRLTSLSGIIFSHVKTFSMITWQYVTMLHLRIHQLCSSYLLLRLLQSSGSNMLNHSDVVISLTSHPRQLVKHSCGLRELVRLGHYRWRSIYLV